MAKKVKIVSLLSFSCPNKTLSTLLNKDINSEKDKKDSLDIYKSERREGVHPYTSFISYILLYNYIYSYNTNTLITNLSKIFLNVQTVLFVLFKAKS